MTSYQPSFRDICENNGYRVTTVRQQLFTLLTNVSPISAGDYIANAQSAGFDMVTIYRTLDLFRKLGLTDEYGYGKKRILHVRNNTEKHYHFIRCSQCKKAVEFKSETIEKQLESIALAEGFGGISSHFLEVIGVCSNCSGK